MRCEDARPYVSVLYDGEAIPREAAEHISACAACRRCLGEYATLGTELRLLASRQPEPTGEQLPALHPQAGWRWARLFTARLPVPRYGAMLAVAAIVVLTVGLGFLQAQRATEATIRAFYGAIQDGDVALVAQMLQENPSLANTRSAGEQSPLHTRSGRLGIEPSTWVEMTRILLAAGADVNARNGLGRTPLHVAGWGGELEVANLLLESGADVNVRDNPGMTPLDTVLSFRREGAAMAELLIAHGAEMNIFHAAALGKTEFVAEQLGKDPFLVNARDNWGLPLLLIAAMRYHHDTVRTVLSYHPTMDIFLAAAAGQVERVREFLDEDPSLVNAHISKEEAHKGYPRSDWYQATPPLAWAVGAAHRDVAELLLERGADPNLGQPLHKAARRGHREMARLLLRYGADVNAGRPKCYQVALAAGHRELAEELMLHARKSPEKDP